MSLMVKAVLLVLCILFCQLILDAEMPFGNMKPWSILILPQDCLLREHRRHFMIFSRIKVTDVILFRQC
jgi:hypothetical protein